MSSLKHMIDTMVAGMKLDTDHSFQSIQNDLTELDRKLGETEQLFMQAIAAVREHRGRIQKVLNPYRPQEQQLPPENPIPRAIQHTRRQA